MSSKIKDTSLLQIDIKDRGFKQNNKQTFRNKRVSIE